MAFNSIIGIMLWLPSGFLYTIKYATFSYFYGHKNIITLAMGRFDVVCR